MLIHKTQFQISINLWLSSSLDAISSSSRFSSQFHRYKRLAVVIHIPEEPKTPPHPPVLDDKVVRSIPWVHNLDPRVSPRQGLEDLGVRHEEKVERSGVYLAGRLSRFSLYI